MNILTSLTLAALIAVTPVTVQAQTSVASQKSDTPEAKYQSIRNEIKRSIERGLEYLESKQSADGYWGTKDYPAMTALALTATLRAPEYAMVEFSKLPPRILKGYEYLVGQQKEDGGIYSKALASYNTSVGLLGLLAANNEAYTTHILKARAFLIKQQNHFAPDNPYNGGIGYGGKDAPPTADLSNTTLALEALHYSKQIAKDGKNGEQPELNWDAAIDFISRCQDLPETNDQTWAKGEGKNRGGFVYRPNESKADEGRPLTEEELKEKKEPLTAYGSISYAGLQSLIYAELKQDDPRVKAVIEWLSKHFTLDENPGMGEQGLYYYFQAMSKALSAAKIDTIKMEDGTTIDWRDKLAQALITKQKSDGSWVNTNNRWWETDPLLVTCYTLLALEQLYYSIPEKVEAPAKDTKTETK